NSNYRFERDSELPTETLCNEGKGSPVGFTGMTWSGFRPSDDACTYHYLIPSNMLAAVVLKGVQNLPLEKEIVEEAKALAEQIEEGIYKWGVVQHPEFGEIFAYEVDGLGNYLLMDDANLPSLLGAPWFGFCKKNSPVYQNTRRFLLSKSNPFYYSGKLAKGIGSPHTPKGYVWHIALAVQGLTADSMEEKKEVLNTLLSTTAGTFHMHEGFHPDRPEEFTRPWFAWADSMFCLLAAEVYSL
ncbi:MAG: glycoside hydrolase family 125 protein, partial [Lachnospiraceae bacterium]|nr:glycoside hydrolase family 125 protein [Lachnospiraceae bacterium]